MKDTNNKKRSWKRLVTILSCVVVFCTTYALILPAVAQSKTYVDVKLKMYKFDEIKMLNFV